MTECSLMKPHSCLTFVFELQESIFNEEYVANPSSIPGVINVCNRHLSFWGYVRIRNRLNIGQWFVCSFTLLIKGYFPHKKVISLTKGNIIFSFSSYLMLNFTQDQSHSSARFATLQQLSWEMPETMSRGTLG